MEHDRPKRRVTECPEHSGYWWLAFDWANLFLACRMCARERLLDQRLTDAGLDEHVSPYRDRVR